MIAFDDKPAIQRGTIEEVMYNVNGCVNPRWHQMTKPLNVHMVIFENNFDWEV